MIPLKEFENYKTAELKKKRKFEIHQVQDRVVIK